MAKSSGIFNVAAFVSSSIKTGKYFLTAQRGSRACVPRTTLECYDLARLVFKGPEYTLRARFS